MHRDLKPANVKLRPDGTVKVLDFAIAKVLDTSELSRQGAAPAVTAMPNGVIGTPAYMSPEQASGSAVDRRADIWAFGCLLYEMLTGHRAFDGNSASAVLARVIEREPDWSKLPPTLPRDVRLLREQCLAKNPRHRRRDAGDLWLDVQQLLAVPMATPSTPHRPAVAVVLALGMAGLGAALMYPGRPAPMEAVRFSVTPPRGGEFATSSFAGSGEPVGGTLSPDGRMLAFTAFVPSGAIMLWVRPLESLAATPLPGTEDAALPFWSPDSAAIGFFARGELKRVAASGGPTQTLAAIFRGQGGAWNRDGTIVFAAICAAGCRA